MQLLLLLVVTFNLFTFCIGANDVDAHKQFFKSAMDGHLDEVEAGLAAGTPVGAADAFGNTALHWASWSGHDKVVAALLKAGAVVDQLDSPKDKNTALMKAAFNGYKPGHVVVVRALLAAGAKVEAKNLHGLTALQNAAMRGYNKIAAILIKEGGADPKAKDQGGVTSLHKASFKGHLDVMETLIEAGADVNARRDDGITPMMLAESVKQIDAMQILSKHGGIREKKQMMKPQGMGGGMAREL